MNINFLITLFIKNYYTNNDYSKSGFIKIAYMTIIKY